VVSDGSNAPDIREDSGERATTALPQILTRTVALSEKEQAALQNERAAKYRQRFIYSPLARFAWRPLAKASKALNGHDGAETAFATVVLAILTAVLAWYASGQERILTQHIEDSRSEKRAFIFLDGYEVSLFANTFNVIPKIKNSGTTAPVDMRMHDNWKWFPGIPPTNYSFRDLDRNGNETTTVESNAVFVGPQATTNAAILNIPLDLVEIVSRKIVQHPHIPRPAARTSKPFLQSVNREVATASPYKRFHVEFGSVGAFAT
jgi:hypothetical protein